MGSIIILITLVVCYCIVKRAVHKHYHRESFGIPDEWYREYLTSPMWGVKLWYGVGEFHKEIELLKYFMDKLDDSYIYVPTMKDYLRAREYCSPSMYGMSWLTARDNIPYCSDKALLVTERLHMPFGLITPSEVLKCIADNNHLSLRVKTPDELPVHPNGPALAFCTSDDSYYRHNGVRWCKVASEHSLRRVSQTFDLSVVAEIVVLDSPGDPCDGMVHVVNQDHELRLVRDYRKSGLFNGFTEEEYMTAVKGKKHSLKFDPRLGYYNGCFSLEEDFEGDTISFKISREEDGHLSFVRQE